jgi:hypothetical protein
MRRLRSALFQNLPDVAPMEKAVDGRVFTGQYRIEAQPRAEGLSLRLSFDADILVRLADDAEASRPRLEVADVAGASDAAAAPARRRRVRVALVLAGLGFSLAALVWLPERPVTSPDASSTLARPLPDLPAPLPETPAPPQAPPVIRLDPVPVVPLPLVPGPLEPRPVIPPRAAPPVPAHKPTSVQPPSVQPPVPATTRAVKPPADVLDLFDDTK